MQLRVAVVERSEPTVRRSRGLAALDPGHPEAERSNLFLREPVAIALSCGCFFRKTALSGKYREVRAMARTITLRATRA